MVKGAGPAIAFTLAGLLFIVRPVSKDPSVNNPPAPTLTDFDGELAAALVARATRDIGVVETSHNSGKEIDAYLKAVKEAPGSNWCAAAVSAWLKDAYAAVGRPCPVSLVSGAKLLGRNLEAAGWRRVPRALGNYQNVPPGSIPVWDRSAPGTPAYYGHIGVLTAWPWPQASSGGFETVEGNSGTDGKRVARMQRRQNDAKLMDFYVPVLKESA